MTSLSINVDIAGLTKDLADTQTRQIPYAMTKALNALATEDVQPAERHRLRQVFTLRREAWADRSIKITHFAKKAEPWVTIAIKPPGAQDRSDILGKFETDTEKRAIGGHGVAVPMDVKRGKGGMIAKGKRPGALHLHREGGRIVGDQGTFIVRLADGRELLLKRQKASRGKLVKTYDDDDNVTSSVRIGARAASNTLLYIFRPSVHIRPDLHFVPTATEVVSRMWPTRFTEALALALSTAR